MKKTQDVYLVSFASSVDGEIITTLWDRKPNGEQYTVHYSIPVEYEEPSRSELVAGVVKSLEAEREKVKAEAHARQVEITAQIQSLLAIEHQEE